MGCSSKSKKRERWVIEFFRGQHPICATGPREVNTGLPKSLAITSIQTDAFLSFGLCLRPVWILSERLTVIIEELSFVFKSMCVRVTVDGRNPANHLGSIKQFKKSWEKLLYLNWCSSDFWTINSNIRLSIENLWLGGGFTDFLFSPLPGEMILFD